MFKDKLTKYDIIKLVLSKNGPMTLSQLFPLVKKFIPSIDRLELKAALRPLAEADTIVIHDERIYLTEND